MNIRNLRTRTKVVIAGGVAVSSMAIAGGAFAYFTSTSTGTGTGTGSVGSPSNWTVAAGSVSGTIYPGQGSETIGYTVTNPGSANQELNTLSVAVNADANGNITHNGTSVSGCLASWFVPVIAHTGTGTSNTISPNQDLVPAGQYTSVVTLTMTDAQTSQNLCQGAAPDVVVSAS